MRVKLRNPDRVVDVSGPRTVVELLRELRIVPEAVLVIRDATLLTRDERLTDDDELEVRPVLSGGAGEPQSEFRSERSERGLSERTAASAAGGTGQT